MSQKTEGTLIPGDVSHDPGLQPGPERAVIRSQGEDDGRCRESEEESPQVKSLGSCQGVSKSAPQGPPVQAANGTPKYSDLLESPKVCPRKESPEYESRKAGIRAARH